MNPSFYVIKAVSNLHVGSGEANYGIIDKLVQRDEITGFPVIHASSLKGALLQHIYMQDGINDDYIDEVFGRQMSESRRKDGVVRATGKKGDFVFMEASLLSFPARCNSNDTPFYRVSSPALLRELVRQMTDTGFVDKNSDMIKGLTLLAKKASTSAVNLFSKETVTTHLEDIKSVTAVPPPEDLPASAEIQYLLGEWSIILPDTQLKLLTDNHHLPVITRNHLENGQSTNLWYEQVLPRQTRLWFSILLPSAVNHAADFSKRITGKGLVQIGANASVGYGYCDIKKISL